MNIHGNFIEPMYRVSWGDQDGPELNPDPRVLTVTTEETGVLVGVLLRNWATPIRVEAVKSGTYADMLTNAEETS